MTKMLLTSFLLAGLAIASAKTYDVSFNQPVTVAGTELQAGGYKLDLDGDKVVIRNRKQSVQSSVKVEQGDKKYGSTLVQLSNEAGGKFLIQEIDLGGTKTKLVFSD